MLKVFKVRIDFPFISIESIFNDQNNYKTQPSGIYMKIMSRV